MGYDNAALLWVDIETTCLNPDEGQILELGLRITDAHLKPLAEASWVVHFPRENLSNLSDLILDMHTKNGLLFAAMKSDMSTKDVEREARSWVWGRLPYQPRPPMAGSTVSFDRAWLKQQMPEIDDLAHYRSFDVSTIKLAARLWHPSIPLFKSRGTHRALADIEDSIAELNYYIGAGVLSGG